MKIKDTMIRLHFRTANIKVNGDYKTSTKIVIIDSKDNIYLELSSISDEVMPDFSEYIGKTIVVMTQDGTIRGVIKDVKKWFGQDVYIVGDIISEKDWFLNWSCHYGYWEVEPKELFNSLIESPLSQCEISLDEYLLIKEKANELYSDIYRTYNNPYFEKDRLNYLLPKIPHSELEKKLKYVFLILLYIKRNEPKLYELIISGLENKQQQTTTERKQV